MRAKTEIAGEVKTGKKNSRALLRTCVSHFITARNILPRVCPSRNARARDSIISACADLKCDGVIHDYDNRELFSSSCCGLPEIWLLLSGVLRDTYEFVLSRMHTQRRDTNDFTEPVIV